MLQNLQNRVPSNYFWGVRMKNYFSTVVEYVKNLFPGCAPAQVVPSDDPALDAAVLATLSTDTFYVTAHNGGNYWYCFTSRKNMPVAKYILASNGINTSEHNSRYFYDRTPVLRVRTAWLNTHPQARKFVNDVMHADVEKVSREQIDLRIAQIRQKVK